MSTCIYPCAGDGLMLMCCSRANSMKITEKEKAEIKQTPKEPPKLHTKQGDVPVESFQRGAFYS